MSIALQKTLSLLLMIVIGLLLKRKVGKKEQLDGIKVLILSIALPATIFVALLKSELDRSLIILPVMTLVFNVILLLATKYLLPWFGVTARSPEARTLMLLLPSLAPGLSCFPLLLEYLGEQSVAYAALADLGNKVFVLIFLYLLAMRWFYALHHSDGNGPDRKNRLRGLFVSLLQEPVNAVIVVAILLMAFRQNLQSLPLFIQDAIVKMSLLMTPMVLLFIGMAVRINLQQFLSISRILIWRAGFTLLSSALLFAVVPLSGAMAVLAVVFPLSSTSFWPFAHISAVASMEHRLTAEADAPKTFNVDLALNVMALSLPFSTLLILCLLNCGDFFLQARPLALLGAAFIIVSALPALKIVHRRKKLQTAR